MLFRIISSFYLLILQLQTKILCIFLNINKSMQDMRSYNSIHIVNEDHFHKINHFKWNQ